MLHFTITDSAKQYLYNIAKKNDKKFVSFGVSGGGCAGFSYKWDYIDEPDKGHTVFHIKDEVSLAVDTSTPSFQGEILTQKTVLNLFGTLLFYFTCVQLKTIHY